ncbi:MAG: O-antigen ligase family protein, partial [Myxococcota bacterium]|nr:O-antigen ligase family protein [Myxococcota bacterium]
MTAALRVATALVLLHLLLSPLLFSVFTLESFERAKASWLHAAALALAGAGAAGLLELGAAGASQAARALAVLGIGLWRRGDRAGARGLALVVALVLAAGLAGLTTGPGRELARHARARAERALAPEREPRSELWRLGASMFAAHPGLGVGLDAFQLAYPAHQSPDSWRFRPDQAPRHAHNEILNVAATQGLVGLAAVALLGLGCWRAARRALRERDAADALACCAGLAAFVVHGTLSSPAIAIGVFATTWMGLLSARTAAPPEPDARREPGAWGFGLAAALGAVAFAGNALAAGASRGP